MVELCEQIGMVYAMYMKYVIYLKPEGYKDNMEILWAFDHDGKTIWRITN